MNKIIFLIVFSILISACSEDVKLKTGTPHYELAKEFSQKVPEMDPDCTDYAGKIWKSD